MKTLPEKRPVYLSQSHRPEFCQGVGRVSDRSRQLDLTDPTQYSLLSCVPFVLPSSNLNGWLNGLRYVKPAPDFSTTQNGQDCDESSRYWKRSRF